MFKKSEPIPESAPLCWAGDGNAPLFTFYSLSLTAARLILFEPFPSMSCAPRQLRFLFYHGDELLMKSKVIDLMDGFTSPITYDLETEVVFDKVVVDIIQNWGDEFKTCLSRFHIYGPKF